MSSKTISLPRPKAASGKSKVIVLVLVVFGGYFVLTDPFGSSEAVKHVFANVATFVGSLRGGGW